MWPCVISFPQDGSEPLFSSLFCFLPVLLLSFPHQPGNIVCGNVWAKKRWEQERERWERGIWRRRGNEDRWNRGEEEEEVGKRNIVLKWRGSDGDENVKCNSTLRRLETVSVLCPPLFLSPSFSAYLWRLFLEIALLQIKAHKHMHSLSHTYISLYFYLWGL